MELDPHTLQQILQKIRKQMRCPQCGSNVPVDFASVRVVSDSAMLLQLQCDGCSAFIVLHASLQGVDQLGVRMEDNDGTTNASSTFQLSQKEIGTLREALESFDGSFEKMFQKSEASNKTDIA